MKTIAVLAEELNVTPQAVYKKIKQLKQPFKEEFKVHTKKGERGETLVDSEGEAILKQRFNATVVKPVKQPFNNQFKDGVESKINLLEKGSKADFEDKIDSTTFKPFNNQFNDSLKLENDRIVKLLQDNIDVLQKQLEIKDRQIEELTSTIKIQAESINAERKNELVETLFDGQKKIDIKVNEQLEKKNIGFFKKLFGKF